MPPRQFDTEEKTTTPEGSREYKRLWARRERAKTHDLINEQRKYYYIEVYQATEDQQNIYRETITNILKTHFENLKLTREIEFAKGIHSSLPTKQPVATLKVSASNMSELPKVSVVENETCLIPFYRREADKFYETYKGNIDVNYDDVVSNMASLQHYTLAQLTELLEKLRLDKKENILHKTLQEWVKAHKILEGTLGHPDGKVQYEKLRVYRESVEKSEQLYLEAMLILKREGIPYFEADSVSAKLAFPHGKDDDPYFFHYTDFHKDDCLKMPETYEHHLTTLKVHSNPALSEWFEREKAETEIKKKIWLEHYYLMEQKRAAHQAWRTDVEGYLTRFIENGRILEELRVEIQEGIRKGKFSAKEEIEILEIYERLKLTVKPKKAVLRVKDE